jgi:hypothetical protein
MKFGSGVGSMIHSTNNLVFVTNKWCCFICEQNYTL